ncbi:MAG: hypothetical protein K2W33_07535 [Burkholderiales bacterium]|nr:hypothetical protein [Burkholderiales bacterium]
MNPKIYPVIHYLDQKTAQEEAAKAVDHGANGLFMISHRSNDAELLTVAADIQRGYPAFPVGINLLSTHPQQAAAFARKFSFPMLWCDDAGVDSDGLTELGASIWAQMEVFGERYFDVFAGVAFKYRPFEPYPALAAEKAASAGFIPTTSGSGTGSAPELQKIMDMSAATHGVLAVASGMTPENIGMYAPYLSHVLVATGIAQDEHRMDVAKLKALISNSRSQL